MLDLTPKNLFDSRHLPQQAWRWRVNRTELIDAVASSADLDKKQADAAVMAFISSVVSEIKAGNKVSVFGFGTFNPKSLAARTGRNPQTGAPVKIAASKAVRFAPAAAFKAALNTRGTKKAAATKAPAKKVAPARKTTAAKVVAKAPAKKATAAKAPAAKAPAKKAVAAKAPAKKVTTAAKAAKKR
jgi:DNA-binding protein HU-beta